MIQRIPNIRFTCAVCQKDVARYVSPANWQRRKFLYCSSSCRGLAGRGVQKPEERGTANPNWRGGRFVNAQGYALLYRPDHPQASKGGYVMEHRVVMEQELGRYLSSSEVVHHINRCRSDNRPGNLMMFPSQSAHITFERSKAREATINAK